MRELLIMTPQLVSILFMAGTCYLQARTLNSGPGPAFVSVKDYSFGAKGDLRTCADVQIWNGSTVLFSPAQCNFSPDDVNKWVQVPLAGDSFGTGLSAQIVSVQDFQHATLSVAAAATVRGAVRSYTDLAIQANSAWLMSSFQSPFTPRQIGSTLTVTGGAGFTPKTVTIVSVNDAGVATVSSSVGKAGSTGGTGTATLLTTIATGDYGAIRAAAAYACVNPGTTVLFPPGAYYIERYRIDEGTRANGVKDITWTECQNTTVLGYQAMISSNGSFRRGKDSGKGASYENSVSPFRLIAVSNFTIQGLELDGNVDKATKAAGVYEGQNYGIITESSRNVTVRNVNTHDWPTDGILIGLPQNRVADRIVELDDVWSHNNGRMGLTLSNVNGFTAINLRCSEVGAPFTGGYGGHPPEDCVDIEPPITADVPTGNVLFKGGSLASGYGGLFAATPGGAIDVTVDGVTFDDSMNISLAPGASAIGHAARTLVKNSTFYTKDGKGFGCGQPYLVPALQRADYVNNTFIMQSIPEIFCNTNDGSIRPVHFVGNHVFVTGRAAANGAINLDHMEEVAGNDFFISKNAKYAGDVKVVNYTDTESVHDNVYSTDLTNAADPYSVNYNGVHYLRNEKSQNPEYFLATPTGGGK